MILEEYQRGKIVLTLFIVKHREYVVTDNLDKHQELEFYNYKYDKEGVLLGNCDEKVLYHNLDILEKINNLGKSRHGRFIAYYKI